MRPLIGITGRRYRLGLLQGADEVRRPLPGQLHVRLRDRGRGGGGLPVHLSYDTDASAVCDWLAGC